MQPQDAVMPGGIGPYRPLRLLGEGGMGQVHLAVSPGGRLVAVKVVRPELAEDAAFRARFDREVRACSAVSGAFTAAVVDADPAAPVPWLATAYVPGPSLQEAVAAHGPMDERTVRTLGAGLAEALLAVHRAGLVHRDMKPGNVLIAGDGPRVIDFGISRALDGTVLTRTGTVLGSPGYMAPEQVAAPQDAGPPCDVFALGATLVYALTGRGPFGTGSAASVLYRIVNSEPNLDGVPPGLGPLLADCLRKDPAARPTPEQLLGMFGAGSAWPPPALWDDLRRRATEAAALAAAPPPPVRHQTTQPKAAPKPTGGHGPNRRRVLGLTAAAVGGVAGLAGVGALVEQGIGGSGARHGAAPRGSARPTGVAVRKEPVRGDVPI
ncbi:serine/threonine-protein kinase [Actinomadura rupiterrae]|uniref:serine/threonine-protein kinase n=1 Tax=Actinomadura rupiterrae TaxID=559627 RepID=UPI0020A51F43|nr:serine/threonine-protein kinase [Actinomadura rupiterrae]MCP2342378.1 serine/threonine protein kinase [Actinomadura rupiterrae]